MPLPSDSPFDIKLSTGRESTPFGLILNNGSLEVGVITQDDSVFVRNVGKRVGDFDEQRSWKGGRGNDKYNDNDEGFWDSRDAWTVTKNHLHSGLLWRFAKGLRKATDNLSNSKSWKGLYGTQRGISVSFTPDESGDYDKVYLWVRWRGSNVDSNTLTLKLHSDSSGSPGTVLQTVTKTIADVNNDWLDLFLEFNWASTQALTAGTTYHFSVYGASTSTKESCWEVACNASGSSSKISSDLSTWSTPDPAFSLLYRITDTDTARRFIPFTLDNHFYVVDVKDDGTTASTIYINGDRGQATGGSTTTLVDTAFGCRSAAWADNVLTGATIAFKKNGNWYRTTIASHTGNTYTFSATLAVAPASGNPYFIYNTPYYTELTGHGLGVVTGAPAVLGQIVYFPQGDTVNMRRMRVDYTAANNHGFDVDSTNKAVLMLSSYDKQDGAIVWRVNNVSGTGSGGDVCVSYSKVKAWGTALAFNTALQAGDTTYAITGLNKDKDGSLYVFKENGAGIIAGNTFIQQISGVQDTPDPQNGVASISVDKFIYYSWLHSVVRIFGSSHDDIGQDYSGFGLPDGREGNFSAFSAYITWVLGAIDAESGTSSVLIWDGLAWHEIFRAYAAGKRIRMVRAQICTGGRNMLWNDCGGELIYQEMPLQKSSPLLDNGALFHHSSVMESSIIDMGTASELPKLIKSMTVTVKNLNSEGREVYLDYRTDENVLTGEWIQATTLNTSPEANAYLNLQNIRRFQYRLRMYTNDASIPIDIEGIIPSGYARTPLKLMWTMSIKSGGIFQVGGASAPNSITLWKWLIDNARYPYSVYMQSKFEAADGYHVIMHPPRMFPYKPAQMGEPEEARFTLVLEEL